MKSVNKRKTARWVIALSIFLGMLFWVVDGLLDYYKFRYRQGFLGNKSLENFLDILLFNIPEPDLIQRIVFFVICLICGLLTARFLGRHLENMEALRISEVRYRRLHETMGDAFVQVDMGGGIIDCNSAFQQMLSYPKERLLQMTMTDLTPAAWHSKDLSIVSNQILVEGKSQVYEKELIRCDGTVFPVELRLFLIRDDSKAPISIWALVRDITQRKKVEAEHENALNALKRSNEDLQQFAYVASHDLQEPLRMVSSYTFLLSERYGKMLDEKAKKYINYAVEGAVRMQALIQDLLAYSRVDTRGVEPTSVDLNNVFGYAVDNLKTFIDETKAKVTADALPRVIGDETQLVAVFQNLIHNGIKFRREATPHIHISAGRENEQENGQWIVAVQDNGIGIDQKFKERIFIIFQRLHARNEYSGTGIGLAMCKRIVERHGGRIWFDSSIGQGTTFFITLPPAKNRQCITEKSFPAD